VRGRFCFLIWFLVLPGVLYGVSFFPSYEKSIHSEEVQPDSFEFSMGFSIFSNFIPTKSSLWFPLLRHGEKISGDIKIGGGAHLLLRNGGGGRFLLEGLDGIFGIQAALSADDFDFFLNLIHKSSHLGDNGRASSNLNIIPRYSREWIEILPSWARHTGAIELGFYAGFRGVVRRTAPLDRFAIMAGGRLEYGFGLLTLFLRADYQWKTDSHGYFGIRTGLRKSSYVSVSRPSLHFFYNTGFTPIGKLTALPYGHVWGIGFSLL